MDLAQKANSKSQIKYWKVVKKCFGFLCVSHQNWLLFMTHLFIYWYCFCTLVKTFFLAQLIFFFLPRMWKKANIEKKNVTNKTVNVKKKKEAQHTSIQVKWWLQNVNKLLTWQQTKSELFKNVIHIRILPLTYSVHGKNRTLFIRCHNSQKLTQDHPQEKNSQIEY